MGAFLISFSVFFYSKYSLYLCNGNNKAEDNSIYEIIQYCIYNRVRITEGQPYYKLVTMGAGAYKMKVPKGLSGVCDRAEYVAYLPKDWDLESDKEEDYWPIRMLKTVARLPVSEDDWLYISHSVNLTKDGSAVAENTKFNSCMLLPSVGKDGQLVKPLKMGLFGKKIAFYQLYPLYQEELEYKLEHSFDELIERIDDEDLNNHVINIHRKNYCK